MTEHYLELILDEARQTIESHPTVGRRAENPLHEYLRFAVLRLLEDDAKKTHTDQPAVPGVTVSYGNDAEMFDRWGDDVEWWDELGPQEHYTRFRIFYQKERVPWPVLEVMASLGAWRMWRSSADEYGSYDHRERNEVHFLRPWNHPIEELLMVSLDRTDASIAPDGGQVMVADSANTATPVADADDRPTTTELPPRTRRAREEAMDVSLLQKGGVYEVKSASGNIYEVDVAGKTCTCPDFQKREPADGCKHLQRVDMEIKMRQVPRPDGRIPDMVATDSGSSDSDLSSCWDRFAR